MLLAIDIGNTNINLGVFAGSRLIRRYIIPTKSRRSCFVVLKKAFRRNKIDDAIVCSVVPQATLALARDLKKLSGKAPIIIGKDIRVPIGNRYRRPGQVGQDRLVNAYAGIELYGSPLIAVDFGTAITFDVISRNKEYLGGLILPGLQLSLEALNRYTALLPKIKLGRPREFIGKDTRNSMLSGVIHGASALTDELVKKIKDVVGRNARVIGTGGNIDSMARYCCRTFDKIDKDLTLKGLNIIYGRRR